MKPLTVLPKARETAGRKRVQINPYTVSRVSTLLDTMMGDPLAPDLQAIIAGGCAYLVDAKGVDIMSVRAILRKIVRDLKTASKKLSVKEE